MDNLTIFNTISIWILIGFLLVRPLVRRMKITIERTFDDESPCGVALWLWRYPVGTSGYNEGKAICSFYWKDE